MKWRNLEKSKCPKCSKDLTGSDTMIVCTKCDFKIGALKMSEIIGKTRAGKSFNPSAESEVEANLSALNNL